MSKTKYRDLFFAFKGAEAQQLEDGSLILPGVLVAEQPDVTGEIWDYSSSIEGIREWNRYFSEATKDAADGQPSVGNMRAQHGKKVAGKFVEMTFDDGKKLVGCVGKVTDPDEVQNVLNGIYTGYSIKAAYAKKWRDGNYTRWTSGKVFEGSIVDMPAIPKATFSVKAANGTVTEVPFRRTVQQMAEAAIQTSHAAEKGMYTASRFMQLCAEIVELRDVITFEEEIAEEDDKSIIPTQLKTLVNQFCDLLKSYVTEQIEEIVEGKSAHQPGAEKENSSMENKSGAAPTTDTGGIIVSKDALAHLVAFVKAVQPAEKAANCKCKEAGAKSCDVHGKCSCGDGKASDDCPMHGKSKAANPTDAAEKSITLPDGRKLIEFKTADGATAYKEAAASGGMDAIAIKSAVEAAFAPVGKVLEEMGNAIKALAGSPAASQVATRGIPPQRPQVVAKSGEVRPAAANGAVETPATAEKTVEELAKENPASAIMKLRSGGGEFITTDPRP